MRLSTIILTIWLLLSMSVFLPACASRTKILNDGDRVFLVKASKSQVKILEETEKNQKVEVKDPSFLDGAFVLLPGQMKRLGEALADCEEAQKESK